MMVGRLLEIWRYPVKSMAGERLTSSQLGPLGMWGDRGWSIRADSTGEICSAKSFPILMQCSASYRASAERDVIPHVDITLCDGMTVSTDSPVLSMRLSEVIGRRVTVAWGGSVPRAMHFDAYPLHILTTSALHRMSQLNPAASWDVRRFRPNLFVDAEQTDFVEHDWGGRDIRIGGSMVRGEELTIRCAMPTHAQGDLPRDPSVLATIARHSNECLGLYASVIEPGIVTVGDRVELLPHVRTASRSSA